MGDTKTSLTAAATSTHSGTVAYSLTNVSFGSFWWTEEGKKWGKYCEFPEFFETKEMNVNEHWTYRKICSFTFIYLFMWRTNIFSFYSWHHLEGRKIRSLIKLPHLNVNIFEVDMRWMHACAYVFIFAKAARNVCKNCCKNSISF